MFCRNFHSLGVVTQHGARSKNSFLHMMQECSIRQTLVLGAMRKESNLHSLMQWFGRFGMMHDTMRSTNDVRCILSETCPDSSDVSVASEAM